MISSAMVDVSDYDLDEDVQCAVCGESDPLRDMIVTDRIVHPECSEPSDRIS